MRTQDKEATGGVVFDALRRINQGAGREIYHVLLYYFADMEVELYNLLWPRQSAEYRKMCSKVKDHNGFEVYRKLWIYHGRGSAKQRVNGLRQLQRYPRCERIENLEKELLN